MPTPEKEPPARKWIARGFAAVEDVVYVGLGVVLGASALALLVSTVVTFAGSVVSGQPFQRIIPLLDNILLILLVVELLYTVQVSFRLHAVTPEPFLLVGLIAAIRRVLILTAEFGHASGQAGAKPDNAELIPELAVLSALIVSIALSLYVLGRKSTTDKVLKP